MTEYETCCPTVFTRLIAYAHKEGRSELAPAKEEKNV